MRQFLRYLMNFIMLILLMSFFTWAGIWLSIQWDARTQYATIVAIDTDEDCILIPNHQHTQLDNGDGFCGVLGQPGTVVNYTYLKKRHGRIF